MKSFLMAGLRRMSYRWKPRSEAMKAARVARGKYLCAKCREVHPRKNIQMDHILPVVPVEGTNDWNVVISRMFVEASAYQCLCKECHKEKTSEENKMRKKK